MKKLLLSIGILLCTPSTTVCRPKNSLIQSIITVSTAAMAGYLFYNNTSQGNTRELCTHAVIGLTALAGFYLGTALMQEDVEPKMKELENKFEEIQNSQRLLQIENKELKEILSQNIFYVDCATRKVTTIPKQYKLFFTKN